MGGGVKNVEKNSFSAVQNEMSKYQSNFQTVFTERTKEGHTFFYQLRVNSDFLIFFVKN